jgi:hypothetical protein
MNKTHNSKKLYIIIVLILILILGIIFFAKSIYSPIILPKPILQSKIVKIQDNQFQVFLYSENCWITNSNTSLPLSETNYKDDNFKNFQSIKNDKTSIRLADDKNKFYWADINPNVMNIVMSQNSQENIRCFDKDIDSTAIPSNKFITIKIIDNSIQII